MRPCHATGISDHVIGGHVPAAGIGRLLTDRPRARGPATPGMPPSAPGTDMPGLS
ncbi:hypothetical protein J8J14_11340 [Roseomonas sp. SSH11]|uniref:Uncharacterized protein n=1 Tax=Pararoseomonas baculiformis TaxID=2820812 RepID=A0ABS4AGM7_9PROT|nr:DUF411 domain-containing protein [Pararoseomonas baculiformis]MBP0445374.1 hypothetical protein [Pararoseomonas baculiformis]